MNILRLKQLNLNKGIRFVFMYLASIIFVSVLIFHFVEKLPWIEAFYFTITTLTTVGYGDYNLHDAQPWLKLYGTFIMVSGPASIAVLVAFISTSIIQSRLNELLGNRGVKLKNHVIVCGKQQLGYRIVRLLRQHDQEVVYVLRDSKDFFLDTVKALKVDVHIGDPGLTDTLEHVMLQDAKSIVIATEDDLKNLSVAVNARAIKPDCRIVLQLTDENLADKMESAFNIQIAFSTPAMVAPAFALAALDPQKSIINSFTVHDEEFVTVKVKPKSGSLLDKKPIQNLQSDLRVTITG